MHPKLTIRKALIFFAHALFWLLPILFYELQEQDMVLGVFKKSEFGFFYPLYYGVAFNVLLFYVSVYYLMPYFKKRFGMFQAVAVSFILYVIVTAVEIGLDMFVYEHQAIERSVSLSDYVLSNFIINFVVMPVVIGYFFLHTWLATDKNRRILREENLRMELEFLKSQINPHFLFNTLNNLYSSARKQNDLQTAQGISQLSGMMRYMIYDSNVDHILLSREVDYLKNYIQLQKIRFSDSDPINISFDVHGETNQCAVAPMMLIPFVENAFKHGISLKENSFIHIELNVLPGHFTFKVENSIFKNANKQQEGGIGLKNIKRRLDLLYPEQYELKIEEKKDVYSVLLNVKTV